MNTTPSDTRERETRAFDFGEEFFVAEDDLCGWVCRDEGIGRNKAKQIAAMELGAGYTEIRSKAVLMREIGEVEANISGYEPGFMIECTSRTKDARSFWRLWIAGREPNWMNQS